MIYSIIIIIDKATATFARLGGGGRVVPGPGG